MSMVGVFVSLKVYKWRHAKYKTEDLPTESLSNEEVMAKFLASGEDEVVFKPSAEGSPSVRSQRSTSSVDSPDPKSIRKRNVKLPA